MQPLLKSALKPDKEIQDCYNKFTTESWPTLNQEIQTTLRPESIEDGLKMSFLNDVGGHNLDGSCGKTFAKNQGRLDKSLYGDA